MEREKYLKEEISQRLRLALARQGNRSIRSLEAEMTGRGSDITSYGAIRSYVQGEKLPPVTFLLEAAEVLSVRPEWLILGEGDVSAIEEELEEEEAMRALRAMLPEVEWWPSQMRNLFMELLGSYCLQAPEGGHVLREADSAGIAWSETAKDLVLLATLPLRAWGFRSIQELTAKERASYLMSMFSALSIALHDVEQGDSFSEYADSLIPMLRGAVDEPQEPSRWLENVDHSIRSALLGFAPDDD